MSIDSVEIGTESLTEVHENKTAEETFLFGALIDLQNTSHLFLKKTDDNRLDGENGYTRFYDVIDTYGIRIFQCIEKTPPDLRRRREQKVFLIVLVDFRGEVIFEYEGEVGERFDMIRANHVWGGVTRKEIKDNRCIFPIEFWKLNDDGIPMSDVLVRDNPNLPHPSTVRTILKKRVKEPGSKVNLQIDESNMSKRKTVLFAERIEQPREVLFIMGEQRQDNLGCCGCSVPIPTRLLGELKMDYEAEIMLPDKKTRVGRISKTWSTLDDIRCDKDEVSSLIGIHFPKRTDVRIKALLLGTLFMLDPVLFLPHGT